MTQIFYWVLNMAIVGSMVGILLLLLRKIKKLPRKFIYALYSLLLIRLICPFGIANGFSILNLLPKGTVRLVDPITGQIASEDPSLLMLNFIQGADSYRPWQLKSNGWEIAYRIGSRIWLVIAIALLLSYCFMYILAIKELKKATKIKDNIYQSDAVNSPMTVGIFHSRIILPLTLKKSSESYPYVIAHEKTHIKNHDNLWRCLSIVITCIYWFNPLCWILQKCFFEDMELACDETTIKTFNDEERRKYASALLALSDREPLIYTAGFAAGSVKVRIKRVISYKKITLVSGVFLIGLFVLCAVCSLSNR